LFQAFPLIGGEDPSFLSGHLGWRRASGETGQ